MDVNLRVTDRSSVVEAMSMTEIIEKESLLNRMNKQYIGNSQYLNSERRGNLQRKLSTQNMRDKPKKACDCKLGKLSKKEKYKVTNRAK